MQAGGSSQPGLGSASHGRSPASAAASPSSSSSAVSAPHLGIDLMQQQQQQKQQNLQQQQRLQQQLVGRQAPFMQSLQQQMLRKPDGNETFLAFQGGGHLGGANFTPSGPVQHPQQPRKFMDMNQQHIPPHMREDGQIKGHGHEQQSMNSVHHAYIQYAYQAAQQKAAFDTQAQQQAKLGIAGPSSFKDSNMCAAADQAQESSSKRSSEPTSQGERQVEPAQRASSDQRNESRLPMQQQVTFGNSPGANSMRPMPQAQQNMQNQMALAAQLQAWAMERNIDLSQPMNANLVAQLIPLMQSRMMSQQKPHEGNSPVSSAPAQRHQVTSPPVANESSPRSNTSTDVSTHFGSSKARQGVQPGQFGPASSTPIISSSGNISVQQVSNIQSRDNSGSSLQTSSVGSGMVPMLAPKASVNLNQGFDQSSFGKISSPGQDTPHLQNAKQLNQYSQLAGGCADGGPANQLHSRTGSAVLASTQQCGFTKQQLHVLKAQILAFRRIKKGESTLPQELLRSISPPPLDVQLQPSAALPGVNDQDKSSGRGVDDNAKLAESNEKKSLGFSASMTSQNCLKEELADQKVNIPPAQAPGGTAMVRDPSSVVPSQKEDMPAISLTAKLEVEDDNSAQRTLIRNSSTLDRGKSIATASLPAPETTQTKKSLQVGQSTPAKDASSARKYHGPLFDFPCFTRKHDSFGSSVMASNNNNLTLAYQVKDLLLEEGAEVLNKKRESNLKKIGDLLAVNLERKRIRPDLVLRLQIEEKKLKLLDLQARLRDKVDQEQQEIMTMTDREYRKFVKICERQRLELSRQVQASQKAMREKQLKSIFSWRKKLLEAHWAIRDARTARNRGVAKYHEKMMREFSKRKDEDRNKRMEALKNNDVERYREMLLEQQTNIPGDAGERYAVLSSFLSQTEEYLQKLGGKITAAKGQQEVEEAAAVAAAAARGQGLSEEEIRAAAACAGEEVMIRIQFSEMNAPRDSSTASKYYSLAHAVNERVARQPSMLRKGTLRDYQLVGLQWMLSLYNNKLNGILADEMGLGKTVQVMALIAYLMEFKGNYGPHLIIVPNAVLVNWKSELHSWLPSVSCIYYVGNKEQRTKLFSQEVCAMKFNVLVTTYEFIMFDKSKLSKVDWKYIIIDEAQRMKDRESVLARDLDKYRCQRRLLLTGTPLQNDLKELWSLLNLLLPEVFDNRKAFHDWFSQPFQKEVLHNAEDDWLETEKKVIIIHRLHQILEPFMLRRRVEDVEGSLPPKVSIVLKCKMSPMQGAIYDWVKATGTIRVDPDDERIRVQKNPRYQARAYKILNNRCMELRKVCNHPLLSYPYYGNLSKDFLVRSCGKLWILDRILVKLQRTGHRVLLFSTMTKLLDLLEEYLQWRQLVYRRIDGTTSLEDRESAIVEFNSPNTNCFIFLLSIRAAGRGLNLQTADTVIIYDPDPNPKNEEQAVARAHRIGQTREVKVIYMEAVVDKIASHQKEDEFRSGGTVDSDEEDLAGKDRYIGSIESLIRNNIQQYKIDMADEVINAGRFDQRTTHEERRMTLETLLHDEERYQETVHDVPSLQEVNRMIARSDEEIELFDQMDEDFDWAEEMMRYDHVPEWLRCSSKEVNATIASLSNKKSRDIFTSSVPEGSGPVSEKRRGGRKGKKPVYTDMDEENGEFSEASSEDRNGYTVPDEEGEIGDDEDEEEEAGTPAAVDKDQSEDDGHASGNGYQYPRVSAGTRDNSNHMTEEPASPGSSSDSQQQKLIRTVSPSTSSQKFTSLSALDSRPSSGSKKQIDDLEEGEIGGSGDSHMEIQRSGSSNHDRDEGEDEQVLQQPKIKRKRSIRLRPRPNLDRQEDRSMNERLSLHRGEPSKFPFQGDHKFDIQLKVETESSNQEQSELPVKPRRGPSTRRVGNASKLQGSQKHSRMSTLSAPEETEDSSRGNWDSKGGNSANSNSSHGAKMSDVIQRRCKNVISKFQRRLDKEGPQIVPLLTELWKRMNSSGYMVGPGNHLLDLRRIDQRIDRFEYSGVVDLISDVQLMLRNAMQHYGFSYEVRTEARKVHDLFFDILKIAFPDSEFREAKASLSFVSATAPTSVSSPRSAVIPTQKHPKLLNMVDRETSLSPRISPRGSTHHSMLASEESRGRVQKESRLGGSTSIGGHHGKEMDDPHPGELVVCKKKRKDREKSNRSIGAVGPISPSATIVSRNLRSPPGLVSGQRDGRLSQGSQSGWGGQPSNGGSGSGSSGGGLGWANPVKRLRTDAGKRRPSHL